MNRGYTSVGSWTSPLNKRQHCLLAKPSLNTNRELSSESSLKVWSFSSFCKVSWGGVLAWGLQKDTSFKCFGTQIKKGTIYQLKKSAMRSHCNACSSQQNKQKNELDTWKMVDLQQCFHKCTFNMVYLRRIFSSRLNSQFVHLYF